MRTFEDYFIFLMFSEMIMPALQKFKLKQKVKKSIFKIFLASLAVFFLFRCDGENDTPHVDAITMATPNGGTMKPAEEGPERSALGVPTIDLTTYQLEVTGLVDSSFSLTWQEIQAMPAFYTDTIIMYCVEGEIIK